jgi:endonuclease YncB( thermonuclease family)
VGLLGYRQGGCGPGANPGPQFPVVGAIYDGDTLVVLHHRERTKIRLYCVDAPEMDQTPWGPRARRELEDLVPEGSQVEVRAKTRDIYGRTVAEIYLEGDLINLELVRRGAMAVFPRYCQDEKYFQAEAKARGQHLGIWKQKGLHQRPWKWRN